MIQAPNKRMRSGAAVPSRRGALGGKMASTDNYGIHQYGGV